MANFNKVYLIGNLTRDPELRVTPRGTSICQFGLAINREWQSKGQGEDSEKQSETTFVDVEAWGKQGEAIAKYCTKGKQLFVEGRLKLDAPTRSALTATIEARRARREPRRRRSVLTWPNDPTTHPLGTPSEPGRFRRISLPTNMTRMHEAKS